MAALTVSCKGVLPPRRITYVTPQGAYTPQQFGGIGDGVADDTEALFACFTAWLNDPGSNVTIPPGRYRITDGLVLEMPSSVLSSLIEGYGATIVMDGSDDYGLRFTETDDFTSHLTINGLGFDGCGMSFESGSTTWLYGLTLRDLVIREFGGHGINLAGVFETQIHAPRISAAASNTTGHGINAVASGGVQPSSIDVYGGAVRGGLHGLYAASADCKLFGGTYLQTAEEGIYLATDAHGATVTGVHVENTWTSVAAQEDAGAGIFAAGPVVIEGCYGTQSGVGWQRWVVRVQAFSGSPSIVIGGRSDNMDAFARVEGLSGAAVVLIGVEDHDDSTFAGTVSTLP